MLGTLIQISLRNLLAHKVKSVIVGAILVAGTVLVLLGAALLGTIERTMADGIIGSVSGHLQISAEGAKDPLVLFPGPLDGNEIGVIEDFPKVRAAIEALPGVKAVVPQGFDYAMIFAANLIDTKLARLRELHKLGKPKEEAAVRDHVRRIVTLLDEDLSRIRKTINLDRDDTARRGVEDVHKAAQPAFWADFAADFDRKMEFLENRVAQMAVGEDILFLRYMGTDTARFRKSFERFEMLKGEPTPAGMRGLMLNSLYYEEFLKQKTARRLDKIRDKRALGASFATDDELIEWRRMNLAQYKEVTWQLDDLASERVRGALLRALGESAAARPATAASGDQSEVDRLVLALLDTNDDNFDQRYKLFYDVVAPELKLYRVDVGDTLTIRAVSQGGYMSSVNVKVYGVFRFRGMDKSPFSGGVCVMDIVSYRDLYGYVTAEQKQEISTLEVRAGVVEIAADKAEDELFGDDATAIELPVPVTAAIDVTPTAVADGGAQDAGVPALAQAATPAFDEFAGVDMAQGAQAWNRSLLNAKYEQRDIDGGVVRNAAVLLHNREDASRVGAAIQELSKRDGLRIKVMNWQEAAGILGQFVAVIYAVLLIAILGVFGVALLVINNSMVLSTLERTREIGTIRAIGGSRRFVLIMFLIESVVLGVVFGVIGVLVGSGIIATMGEIGIPAANDTLTFVFGGPRLYPTMAPGHVLFALSLVIFVTIVSTLYPALLAVRVTPLEAMQPKEE